MAARLIFPSTHPAIPFLLLLAVADDALGLMLLAVFYPSGPTSLVALVGLMLPAIGVAFWLRARRVRSFWAHTVIAGGLSWSALYLGTPPSARARAPSCHL
jgi:Na+:H+ antiporter, NhaA family